MALKSDYANQECAIARTLEIIGERWTPLILRDCFFGLRRFTDLHRHLGLPRAVLSARLESLVGAGVLERSEYQPGRHEYLLTERGQELWPVLTAMLAWGDKHLSPNGPRVLQRHTVCGQDLRPGAPCQTCETVPPLTEIEIRRGPGRPHHPNPDQVEQALRDGHTLLTPLP
ncbi:MULTISPECIES: helix-turn-helix domain-containing protein [unclassified Crossiella]|uniref:winged helix-turn-helix transcriptional regulator n=1 Tax=unclassified Crossiella TaxID=2620835 RepID=UPI001FFED586|nr:MULTISPECIES: helix-turn-helix domain-containing protein [unclassified Crossiella]MCK2239201.1 helix-turn-helix transcriptional regulator [Crossiella sp. S99.2]MCK2251230.1 helix-turn-helix transcriptional regulator [Crossiella sp. S99.1]